MGGSGKTINHKINTLKTLNYKKNPKNPKTIKIRPSYDIGRVVQEGPVWGSSYSLFPKIKPFIPYSLKYLKYSENCFGREKI